MKPPSSSFPAFIPILLLLVVTQPLFASDRGAVRAALARRMDLVQDLTAGRRDAKEAIAMLRTDPSPGGLVVDVPVERVMALLDVAHRLIAGGHPAEAEPIFVAAEEDLEHLLRRTSAKDVRRRADFLLLLGRIRFEYLGRQELARADLEEAALLQPDDLRVQRMRAALERKTPPVPGVRIGR